MQARSWGQGGETPLCISVENFGLLIYLLEFSLSPLPQQATKLVVSSSKRFHFAALPCPIPFGPAAEMFGEA
jgi:hypothetical protein